MSAGITELALALLAGGLTTLSPCVLPILPLIVGGAVQRNRASPLLMAAGLIASFVVMGVLVGLLGDAFDFDSDVVRNIGAWLMVVFGVVMLVPALSQGFSRLLSPLSNSANQASSGINSDSPWGAFWLGGVLGMVWSPCSGPLLASTLALVASEGGAARGALILGLFGLGAALPMVGIAYASRAGIGRSRDWWLPRIDGFKKAFGVLILLLGIAILLGWDKQFEAYFVQKLPDAWVRLTTLF